MRRFAHRRHPGPLLAAAAAIAAPLVTRAATPANWLNAVSGNWTDGSKWSSSPNYPNNNPSFLIAYDVTIAAAGSPYTVSLANDVTVDSLVIDSAAATFQQTGGTLHVNNGIDLRSGQLQFPTGTLQATTVTSTTGATWQINSYGGTLKDVTADLDTHFNNSGYLTNNFTLLNGHSLTFTGGASVVTINPTTITGNSEIVFTGGGGYNYNQIEPYSSLTIGPGITVRSGGGNGYLGNFNSYNPAVPLINKGLIKVDVPGRTIGMQSYWSNQGMIQVSAGELEMGGIVTTAGLGTIQRTGGEIELMGTIDNTAATLTLNSTTGSWRLQNGTITGGTVNLTQSATFSSVNGTLDGAALHSDNVLVVDGSLRLKNNASIAACPISLAAPTAGSGASLGFLTPQTFDNVNVTFDGASEESFIHLPNVNGTVTIGPGSSIKTGTRGGLIEALTAFGANVVNQGLIWASTAGKSISLLGNWSNQGILRVSDTATLNLGGNTTQASIGTIERTGAGGTVSITGTLSGALALNATTGTWKLAPGGKILNSQVSTAGGAELSVSGGTLDGVTLSGVIRASNGEFRNGLTLAPGSSVFIDATGGGAVNSADTQTLGGSGEWVSSGSAASNSLFVIDSTTLTIASNIVVRTGSAGLRVGGNNSGNSGKVINQGLLWAQTPGRALELTGLWTNQGVLRTSAGSLNLGGQFARGDIGTIERLGGDVNVTGNMDNSGGTLLLNSAIGSWNLSGGTITGGTIATADGAAFTATGGTLKGVVVDTDWSAGGAGLSVNVESGSVLSGHRVTLGNSSGAVTLSLRNGQPLGDHIEVVFAAAPFTSSLVGEAPALTIPSDSLVRTDGGNGNLRQLISPAQTNVNLGLISARTAGNQLTVFQFNNQGTMEAINGGKLTFSESVNTASGSLIATAGSSLTFARAWSNAGTISATDATVNFGGTFTTAGIGSFVPAGAVAVNVTGSMTNTSATLALNPTAGTWTLATGGRISGGTITATGGSKLFATGGTLSGLSLASEVVVSPAASVTASGSISFGAGGRFSLNGTSAAPFTTLTVTGTSFSAGGGEFVFDNGTTQLQSSTNGITFGTGVTLRTGTGSALINSTSTSTALTVAGIVSAETSGQTIAITAGKFTNNGTLQALNGGTLTISGTVTNLSSGTLTGGTWAVYDNSSLSFPGVVTRNSAVVTLSGPASTFAPFDALTTNNTTGNLTVTQGRVFSTASAFTNSGTITLGPSSRFTSTGPLSWTAGTVGGAGDFIAMMGASVTGNVFRSGSGVFRVANGTFALSAGKKLTLSTGKMILEGDSVGTLNGSTYTGTTGLIQSGRNGGAWNGAGIVTSQSDATTGNFTSLGIATASQAKGVAATATTVWGGQTVTGNDTLVMYTYGGDATLDGKINVDDYGRIDFNVPLGTSGWFNGDFNYDSKINVDDYGIIDFNIGIQGAPLLNTELAATTRVASLTAVPEPSAIGLLTASLLMRRRRLTRDPNPHRN